MALEPRIGLANRATHDPIPDIFEPLCGVPRKITPAVAADISSYFVPIFARTSALLRLAVYLPSTKGSDLRPLQRFRHSYVR